jgi:hypothetical protein
MTRPPGMGFLGPPPGSVGLGPPRPRGPPPSGAPVSFQYPR